MDGEQQSAQTPTSFLQGAASGSRCLGPVCQLLIHHTDDALQQLGPKGSPHRVSSPRCTACSSRSGASSPNSPSTHFSKDGVAGSSRPPWSIGTRINSTNRRYTEGPLSPSGHSIAGSAGVQLLHPSIKHSSVAAKLATDTSSSQQYNLPAHSKTASQDVNTAESAPGDGEAANSEVCCISSKGKPAATANAPTCVAASHHSVKDVLAEMPTTSAGAATTGTAMVAASSIGGRHAGVVLRTMRAAGDAEGLIFNPVGTKMPAAEMSKPVSKPYSTKAVCNGRNSTQQKAKSASNLAPMAPKAHARSESAKTLTSNSSGSSSPTQHQLQQLACSIKGTSLKSFQACHTRQGSGRVGVQKPRKSAVDLMLKKQLSTEEEFQQKLQQWKGDAGAAGAIGDNYCAAAADEQQAASLQVQAASMEACGPCVSSQQTDDCGTTAARPAQLQAAATQETAILPTPPVEPAVGQAACMGTSALITVTSSPQADGSMDADASCLFSTPKRAERDLFKKQRTSSKGENQCTSRPAAAQESPAAVAGGDAVNDTYNLESLLPPPSYKQSSVAPAASAVNHNSRDSEGMATPDTVPAATATSRTPLCTLQDLLASSSCSEKSCVFDPQKKHEGCRVQQQQQQQATLTHDQELFAQQLTTTATQAQLLQHCTSTNVHEQDELWLQRYDYDSRQGGQMLLLQPASEQQQHEVLDQQQVAMCMEELLEPIQQRRPSLPMPQQQERQASLPLYLPDESIGDFDLSVHTAQDPAVELPTPHLKVEQQSAVQECSSIDTSGVIAAALQHEPGGGSHTKPCQVSAVACEGACADVQPPVCTSSSGGIRSDVVDDNDDDYDDDDIKCISSGNTVASDDFLAAVNSFRRGVPASLTAAATRSSGQVLPARDSTTALTAASFMLQQYFDSSSIDDVSGPHSASTRSCSATSLHNQQQQAGTPEAGESVDAPRSAVSSSATSLCHHSRHASCHTRQLSMDGSSMSGSEAAALAAIAAELEDIKHSSCKFSSSGSKTAATVGDMCEHSCGGGTLVAHQGLAGESSVISEPAPQGEASGGEVRHSRRVSHHSRQVSMDGCSNIDWLSQLHLESGAEVGAAATAGSSTVLQCLGASSGETMQPSQAASEIAANTGGISSSTHGQIGSADHLGRGVSSCSTQASSPHDTDDTAKNLAAEASAAVVAAAGVPVDAAAAGSLQDLLMLLEQQNTHHPNDITNMPREPSPFAVDSTAAAAAVPAGSPPAADECDRAAPGDYSLSASSSTQMGSMVYHNTEGDPLHQNVKFIWNQVYDYSLAGDHRGVDAAATDGVQVDVNASGAAAAYAAAAAAAANALAGKVSVEENVQPSDHTDEHQCADAVEVDADYSLPPLEVANSLVCMGSSVSCISDGDTGDKQATPAAAGNLACGLARSAAATQAAGDSSCQSRSSVVESSDTIAFLLDMKHLLEEDVNLLRSSLQSLGQPSPTTQPQPSQQKQQEYPLVQTATEAAGSTGATEDDAMFWAGWNGARCAAQQQVSPAVPVAVAPRASVSCVQAAHAPCLAHSLSSRILQLLYPATATKMPADSSAAAQQMGPGPSAVTAGPGRPPSLWGFAAAKIVNTQFRAIPVASSTTQQALRRTLTSKIRSILGDQVMPDEEAVSAASTDDRSHAAVIVKQGADVDGGKRQPLAVDVTGIGGLAAHSDHVLLQVVLQLQLPGEVRT